MRIENPSGRCFSFVSFLLVTCLLPLAAVRAQDDSDELAAGFRNPPESARPRTWWHWINGHTTKEGITKDLEWMKRVGIAGFQMADVSAGGGQRIDVPLEFGTPDWYEGLRHAAAEAERLDLEMALFSSPGWSETGGPWVTPEQGMKRMVWTETLVEGPARFDDILPQAPANLDWYADSVVLAFPRPSGESRAIDRQPQMISSGGSGDVSSLLDGELRTAVTVTTAGGGEGAWLELVFDEPYSARAITISGRAGGRNGIPVGRVLAGNRPDRLQTLVSLPGSQLYRQGRIRTFAIPETSARIWRIEMTGAPLDPALTMSQGPPRKVDSYSLGTFRPHGGARVHRFEEKAGSSQFLFEYETVPTPEVPAETTVSVERIIDLTESMADDGRLKWDVPEGSWVVQRMGYVPTGARNRPATGPGSGLEADKLSREHMEAYFHGYLDPVADVLGPLFGGSLEFLVMDSWEAGMQNWTDHMVEEFIDRRGYDPTPYLPAMAGYVVHSADVSDRFLWDFRRTLADMWAEHHYGTMTRLLEERGMGSYAEAAGVSLEIPEDTLLNKKNVTIPMGEFWIRDLHPRLMYLQDVRGAASASHVYGKALTAAESFTGGNYESPLSLKKSGDYWLAQGINRMVFHTSAHQPLDTKPGNTMVGTHINRNITWAEQAGPVFDYFSKQMFLLQQGQFVADLAYLLNEGAPSTPPIWGSGTTPSPPEGHDFDFINADVLLNLADVDGEGNVVLPSGMSYKLLVLPETSSMRPELLRKLRTLVESGATVLGRRPLASPSLAGFPEADREVAQLAAELWGDLDGVSRTVRHVGSGRVVWGRTPEEALEMIGVGPDFSWGGGTVDAELAWLHRREGDTEIYYVANLTDHPQDLQTQFRVQGMEAELWYPDSGLIEPASYRAHGESTRVPLHLHPRESLFVVFPRKAEEASRSIPRTTRETMAEVGGTWEVSFPADHGAPESIGLSGLSSWTDHEDEGVRYFSGTATYQNRLDVPRSWLDREGSWTLDLGRVGDLAEVVVNGHPLGAVWKPPYRVDVTEALQAGGNSLEIRVTNQWTNRLIGDLALPEEGKVLDAKGGFYGVGETSVPAESGLLGPVTLGFESEENDE